MVSFYELEKTLPLSNIGPHLYKVITFLCITEGLKESGMIVTEHESQNIL